MRKILVLTLVLALCIGCTVTPASAACALNPVAVAVNDGGSTTSRNRNTTTQTASGGGVNQNATVQGNNNAVNIDQRVNYNDSGKHYHNHNQTVINNTTIIQQIVVEPEERINYEKVREKTRVYAEAFLVVLAERLYAEGWSLVWSIEVEQTHNCVISVAFARKGLVVDGYKLLYYTSDLEHYRVALSTDYHAGWRIADYPASQIIFRGLSETDAISMIINWLYIQTDVIVTSTTGCCSGCSCNGDCGTLCGCGE